MVVANLRQGRLSATWIREEPPDDRYRDALSQPSWKEPATPAHVRRLRLRLPLAQDADDRFLAEPQPLPGPVLPSRRTLLRTGADHGVTAMLAGRPDGEIPRGGVFPPRPAGPCSGLFAVSAEFGTDSVPGRRDASGEKSTAWVEDKDAEDDADEIADEGEAAVGRGTRRDARELRRWLRRGGPSCRTLGFAHAGDVGDLLRSAGRGTSSHRIRARGM